MINQAAQWLYRTATGPVLRRGEHYFAVPGCTWDDLFRHSSLVEWLASAELPRTEAPTRVLPPIGSQEVWACGVTYRRSKEARQEEAESAGGGDFYDRVYSAVRPEVFFKATAHRVVGSGGQVRIRKDSSWNVPEPELVAVLSASGQLIGYTVGNDMSSRSIEGENPLYLPQAKTYDGSCALGPGIYLTQEALPQETRIQMQILRGGAEVMSGTTALSQMKRSVPELIGFLTRECTFPDGAFLMTGTGIVPDSGFTLASGDVITITIEPLGALQNTVA